MLLLFANILSQNRKEIVNGLQFSQSVLSIHSENFYDVLRSHFSHIRPH